MSEDVQDSQPQEPLSTVEYVAQELDSYRGDQKNYPEAFLEDYEKTHPAEFAQLSDAFTMGVTENIDQAVVDLDAYLDKYFENQKVVARAVTEGTPESYDAFLDHNWLPQLRDVTSLVGQRLSQDPSIRPLQYRDLHNGRNGYEFHMDYLDTDQVQVTLKCPAAMSAEAQELYDGYVQDMEETLQKIPGYKKYNVGTTPGRSFEFNVGLPNSWDRDEAIRGGYVTVVGKDAIPIEGYEFIEPSSENYAVRKIVVPVEEAPAAAPKAREHSSVVMASGPHAAAEKAPEVKVDYRADAKLDPDKYSKREGDDKKGTLTFLPIDSDSTVAIRIEDLLTKPGDKNLFLTDAAGKEYEYVEKGLEGPSWYSGETRLMLKKYGDVVSYHSVVQEAPQSPAAALVTTDVVPPPAPVEVVDTAAAEKTAYDLAEKVRALQIGIQDLQAILWTKTGGASGVTLDNQGGTQDPKVWKEKEPALYAQLEGKYSDIQTLFADPNFDIVKAGNYAQTKGGPEKFLVGSVAVLKETMPKLAVALNIPTPARSVPDAAKTAVVANEPPAATGASTETKVDVVGGDSAA